MSNAQKVLCFGEFFIDFFSESQEEPERFIKLAGGAPANVAAAIAALGGKPYFIGKLGKDIFGDFLFNVLDERGVRMNYCLQNENCRTTLSFVSHNEQGERSFYFYRNPQFAADLSFHKEDWQEEWFKDTAFLHCGSNCQTSDGSDKSTLHGMRMAYNQRALVSYDPNLRHNLWNDGELLRLRVHRAFPLADIIKLSEDEAKFLFPNTKEMDIVAQLFALRCSLVLITRGPKGAAAFTKKGVFARVKGHGVEAMDTTGAGDSFIGSFLYRLTQKDMRKGMAINLDLVKEDLTRVLDFANRAAALSVTKRGGIDGMPSLEEINRFRS